METKQVKCQNCEKEFNEGFEFCPHCGQKAKDELTIGVLFYNTISNYFSFDARFFKSFIPLMFKPGYLASKFLEGKRLLFLHPAQLYLFISVVFFFITSFAVRKETQDLDKRLKESVENTVSTDSILEEKPALDSLQLEKLMKPLKDNQAILGLKDEDLKKADSIIKIEGAKSRNQGMTFDFNEKKVDSLIAVGAEDVEIINAMGMDDDAGYLTKKFYSQMLKFYKERGAGSILQAMYDTIPIALFFLLPIFAFILKILYFNKGRYAHHLVFSFYFFAFLFTAFSIMYLANLIWDIPDWIDWLLSLSTFFYLFLALKRFYGQGIILSFFKSSVATLSFFIFLIPFSIVLVLFAFMLY